MIHSVDEFEKPLTVRLQNFSTTVQTQFRKRSAARRPQTHSQADWTRSLLAPTQAAHTITSVTHSARLSRSPTQTVINRSNTHTNRLVPPPTVGPAATRRNTVGGKTTARVFITIALVITTRGF